MSSNQQNTFLYCITGDEILLVEENIAQIIAKARSNGYDEKIIIDAEVADATNVFLSHYQNLSLFSTKKILEIRFHQKIPAVWTALFLEIAANPDKNQIVILRMPKLSRAETQAKWYKAIEQTGQIITLWPLKQEGFLRWIQTRMQTRGLKTSREGYALIAANTEGNLLAASQIIEKLHLIYSTNKSNNSISEITCEAIQQMISDHAHYDVFELCDAALSQHPAHCLKILSTLKNQGGEPAIILWALMQDIRKCAILFETAPNMRGAVYQKQGIWSSRQALFQKALASCSTEKLRILIQKAKDADSVIKGAKPGSIWEILEDLCLILSNCDKIKKFSSEITHHV